MVTKKVIIYLLILCFKGTYELPAKTWTIHTWQVYPVAKHSTFSDRAGCFLSQHFFVSPLTAEAPSQTPHSPTLNTSFPPFTDSIGHKDKENCQRPSCLLYAHILRGKHSGAQLGAREYPYRKIPNISSCFKLAD